MPPGPIDGCVRPVGEQLEVHATNRKGPAGEHPLGRSRHPWSVPDPDERGDGESKLSAAEGRHPNPGGIEHGPAGATDDEQSLDRSLGPRPLSLPLHEPLESQHGPEAVGDDDAPVSGRPRRMVPKKTVEHGHIDVHSPMDLPRIVRAGPGRRRAEIEIHARHRQLREEGAVQRHPRQEKRDRAAITQVFVRQCLESLCRSLLTSGGGKHGSKETFPPLRRN